MTTDYNELNHEFFNKIENVVKIIQATGELFISLHLFDLKENKLIPIKSNERISKLSENYSTAQDIVTFVMKNLSVPETLDSIIKFTDLSTLPERLKDERMISQLFQGKYLGWCNTMFVRLDDEEPIRYALCVVQSVDKDIKRINELKRTARENSKLHSIVGALMSEYSTVCSINLNNENVEFLRSTHRSDHVIDVNNINHTYSDLINFYINYGIYKKDSSTAKDFFSIKNLKSTENGNSKSLIYRNVLGEYGEAKLIRAGRNYVLLGFSEKNKEIEELKSKLFTDSLTGVKNRKYYDEELLPQRCHALVMSDLDFFKNVNDTYGHQVGDIVLASVANALRSCVRKTDEIIRYGGDEFILSFSDITPEALNTLLEKMRKTIEAIKIEKYPDINLSMSFGAVYGDSTVENMIPVADDALYVSKEKRNTVTVNKYDNNKILKLKRTDD